METLIKAIASGFLTVTVYLFGGLDIALQSLLIAMLVDYITGIAKGYVTGKLSSTRGFKGIIKKLCMLCMVVVAVIVEHTLGDTGLIRTGIIYYMVANECLSITENLGEMDILVPKTLKDRLEQLRNKDGDNDV